MRIYFCCDAIYGEKTRFDSISFEDSAGNEICVDADDVDFGFQDGKFFGRLKNCFIVETGLDVEPKLEDVKDMTVLGINVNYNLDGDWEMIPVEVDFY